MNSVNSNSNNSNRRKKSSKKDCSSKLLKDYACEKMTSSPDSLRISASVDSVTPKVWTNQAAVNSEKLWKPVRPKLLKQDDTNVQPNHKKSQTCTATAEEKNQSSPTSIENAVSNHETSKHSDNLAMCKSKSGRHVPTPLQIPSLGYRPSFSRSSKSPGFDTIRRRWDTMANQPETASVPLSANRKKCESSSGGSPVKTSRNSWRNVRRSVEKNRTDSVSSGQSTLDLVSPQPFRFDSACDDIHRDVKTSNITRTKDEDLKPEMPLASVDEVNSQGDAVVEDQCSHTVANTNHIHHDNNQLPTDVVCITNSICIDPMAEINSRLDRIDVGVYGSVEENDTDESETEIDAICYDFQSEDLSNSTYDGINNDAESTNNIPPIPHHKQQISASQVVEPFTDTSMTSPDYLPMASQVGTEDKRYIDMTVDAKINEVEYVDHLVVPPPPLHLVKSKREYHEIDPNVPPPPNCEPPKLVMDKKHPPASTESSTDPPPLPPTNAVGRRSLINDTNLEIAQNHLENSGKRSAGGKSTKKLKYVEVEVGQYGQYNGKSASASPARHQKTNYSDVVVPTNNEPMQRERSNSGTSEEGLADGGNKKHMNVKQMLPPFFSKKDSKPVQSKNSEEHLTDFGKERNKKKRISERFLRKKTKDGKHKKEAQNRASRQNTDRGQDSSREANNSPTPGASLNQVPSNVASNSSSSRNSSGDGEVGRVPASRNTTSQATMDANRMPKWKVLPTPNSTANTSIDEAASYKPVPQPRTISMSHRHALSQGESTFLAYPNTQTSNGDPYRPKVSSFLHGGAVMPSADGDGTTIRSQQPPPVPRHKRSSAPTLFTTDIDASSLSQDSHSQNMAPVPLPGLAHLTAPSSLSPPPLLPKSQSDNGPMESFYHAADDDHNHGISVGIYSAADDTPSAPEDHAPPPLPDRDGESFYESISASYVVPPSPMTQEEHGYKFLEEEPLYQIYRSRTLTHASSKRRNVDSGRDKSHSEPAKSISEWESALQLDDLGTSTLWRSIPEVVQSGRAENMRPEELKLQQSQFEVITSQASYLRSLNILVQHFMKDWAMSSHDILPQSDRHNLFSNIETVRIVEQKFLRDLEAHFWQDIKLTKVCDVIAQYAKSEFQVYILYIQNQVYQDRALTKLQRTHERFGEELIRLESSPGSNKLPLLSFLMLPMQRVTRLPLLVTAIVGAADSAGDVEICKKAKHTLGVVNKLVKKCNERARSMHQTEQLAEIASQLDYSSSVKMYALISQSRSLVKKGEMNISMAIDSKKATKTSKLWLFLFSDVLFIAKKKNLIDFGTSPRFEVIDWANRQLIVVNESAVTENAIYLVILENQAGKRVEMSLMPMAQNEISRWETALNPPKLGTAGESIYESWDCPQYTCIVPHKAQQPDELSLDVGDVMQVTKKTADGWLEGERLRDGESGWFLASSCEEIEDEHVRSRNMKCLFKTHTTS